ncbi:MAG: ATP-binding protein [Actinomycetota bacterium]|jgi:serine/threonine-protein kinase RsbW
MLLDVAVCLPQESETVGVIRAIVRHALHSFGVTQECIDDICLALSEACTNVIDHAVPGDEYEVRLEVDERECALSVRNTNHGFDARALRGAMPDASSPRGRGVAIMRAVMDHVDFSSEPQADTMVRLVKALAIKGDSLLDRLRRTRESSG